MMCLTVCLYLVSSVIVDANWTVEFQEGYEGPFEPDDEVRAKFTAQGASTRQTAFGYFEDTDQDPNYGSGGDEFVVELERQVTTSMYGFPPWVEWRATMIYDPEYPNPDILWSESPLNVFDHAVVVQADESQTGFQDREAQTPCVQIIEI
jgi:hypothetical protein